MWNVLVSRYKYSCQKNITHRQSQGLNMRPQWPEVVTWQQEEVDEWTGTSTGQTAAGAFIPTCASITTVLGVFFLKVTSGVYTFVCVNPVSDHFFEGCVLGFSIRQMLFSRCWLLTTFWYHKSLVNKFLENILFFSAISFRSCLLYWCLFGNYFVNYETF